MIMFTVLEKRKSRLSFSMTTSEFPQHQSAAVNLKSVKPKSIKKWGIIVGKNKWSRTLSQEQSNATSTVSDETLDTTLDTLCLTQEDSDHHYSEILLRVIYKWKKFTRLKRAQKDLADSTARESIQRQLFFFWKRQTLAKTNKKWKLEIRANVFRKQALLLAAWKQWKSRQRDRHAGRVFEFKAIHLDNLITYRKALKQWKSYHSKRSVKEQRTKLALQTYWHNLHSHKFLHWKVLASKIKRRRELWILAGIQAKKFTLKRMWTQWSYIASFRSHWKNLDQTAHEHRETSVKTSMINQWTTKYKTHESQRLNENNAQVYYNRKNVQTCLLKWKVNYLESVMVSNLMDLALWTRKKSLLGRLVGVWQSRLAIKLQKKVIEETATRYRHQVIQRRFVETLAAICGQSEQAQHCYQFKIMKLALRKWKDVLEIREFQKSQPLINKSFRHQKKQAINRFFKKWNHATKAAIQKKTNEQKALLLRKRALVGFFLQIWKLAFEQSLQRESMKIQAASHYRAALLIKFWTKWDDVTYARVSKRGQLQKAENYYQSKLVHRVMKRLQEYVFTSVENRYFMECSEVHYNRALALKVTRGWLNVVRQESKKQDMNCLAVRHWYLNTVFRTWQTWQHKIMAQKQLKMRLNLMTAQYDRIVARKHLHAWRELIRAKSELFTSIYDFENLRTVNTLRVSFGTWQDSFEERRRESRMEAIALRVYTKKKQKSAVNVWKQAMLISLANKKEEDQIIEDAQEILALSKSRRILKAWKSVTEHYRMKSNLATQSERFVLGHSGARLFMTWMHKQRHVKWEKKLLIKWKARRSDWRSLYWKRWSLPVGHYKKTLMRGMVFQWKTFAAEERSERNKLIQELISNPAEESSKIKTPLDLHFIKKHVLKWKLKTVEKRKKRLLKETCARSRASSIRENALRPQPRPLAFRFDQEHDLFVKESKNTRDISIRRQTFEPIETPAIESLAMSQSQVTRIDSGIELIEPLPLSLNSLKTLEQIIDNLPKEEMLPDIKRILQQECGLSELETLEAKLVEFKKIKSEYLGTKERAKRLQREVYSSLSSGSKDQATIERDLADLEGLLLKVKYYEDSLPRIKSETLLVSLQLKSMMEQKTEL